MESDDDASLRLARIVLERRRAAQPVDAAHGDLHLPDLSSAYRVQAAAERILVDEHGFVPIGYKIGATNAGSRDLLKVATPFFGRLFRATTTASPARLPPAPDFFRVHEAEIALLIDRDLPPTGAPYDAAAIAAATRAVLPAIEIVGTWLTPWTQGGGTNIVADNAAHGRWIIGAPTTDFSQLDLLDAPITFTVNGDIKATGKGRNVDGGPFGATAWLANALAKLGRSLRAGDYVTTGTVIPPFPVAAGQDVTADFGPLGQVTLHIEAERT